MEAGADNCCACWCQCNVYVFREHQRHNKMFNKNNLAGHTKFNKNTSCHISTKIALNIRTKIFFFLADNSNSFKLYVNSWMQIIFNNQIFHEHNIATINQYIECMKTRYQISYIKHWKYKSNIKNCYNWFKYMHMNDDKFLQKKNPVCPSCLSHPTYRRQEKKNQSSALL